MAIDKRVIQVEKLLSASSTSRRTESYWYMICLIQVEILHELDNLQKYIMQTIGNIERNWIDELLRWITLCMDQCYFQSVGTLKNKRKGQPWEIVYLLSWLTYSWVDWKNIAEQILTNFLKFGSDM